MLPVTGNDGLAMYSFAINRLRQFCFVQKAVLCLLLALGSTSVSWNLAHAQPFMPLIHYTNNAIDIDLPTGALSADQIAIKVQRLRDLRVGDFFYVQVGPVNFARLEVIDWRFFLNGDRSLRAFGVSEQGHFSLSVTFSQQNLFGQLYTSESGRRIYAVGRGEEFSGWYFIPKSLNASNAGLVNDYVIPDYGDNPVTQTDAEIHSTLPFLSDVPEPDSQDQSGASTSEIDASNLQITQSFSRNPVIAGDRLQANISIKNISDEWHQDLLLEFYFLLENTELSLAPPQCSEQLSLSLQEVLYCELGDFAPGEQKSFTYIVDTSEASKPYVVSTPIIGNLRVDSIVNVVEDILTDTDADGISDFNETLLATDPADAESVNLERTVIDVMTLYTPGAAELYPGGVETRINQLIGVANQIYADSGIAIRLRPVFHGRVDFSDAVDMDTALDAILNKSDPAFADIDSLRRQYGADLVMLFRPLEAEASRCGLAPVGGYNTDGYFDSSIEKDYAYSLIGINCPMDMVVAHELGHNMGLTHSHLEDGTGGTFPFATGYGVDSAFVTVMAYPAAFNTDVRVPVFSNPDLDCLGFACGVSSDREFGADAAYTLNLVRHQIASYMPRVVPDLPERGISDTNGEVVNASIALAATIDGGLSFIDSINPGQNVDVMADITVAESHIGKAGSVNVLVGMGEQGYLQLAADGQLVPWDGTVEGLGSASTVDVLRRQERLAILQDFLFDDTLLGQQVAIYAAYQVHETGELIYTSDPLLINVVAADTATD